MVVDPCLLLQVIRVLIIVLVVFVVCWAPYLLLQVIVNARRNLFSQSQYNIPQAASWLHLLTLAKCYLASECLYQKEIFFNRKIDKEVFSIMYA